MPDDVRRALPDLGLAYDLGRLSPDATVAARAAMRAARNEVMIGGPGEKAAVWLGRAGSIVARAALPGHYGGKPAAALVRASLPQLLTRRAAVAAAYG